MQKKPYTLKIKRTMFFRADLLISECLDGLNDGRVLGSVSCCLTNLYL